MCYKSAAVEIKLACMAVNFELCVWLCFIYTVFWLVWSVSNHSNVRKEPEITVFGAIFDKTELVQMANNFQI